MGMAVAAAWLRTVAFGAGLLATSADAAEARLYATITTDYVYRGVTYSDGHGAFQLGGDLTFRSGFFLGAWGSTVDIENGPTRQRDAQVNVYAGYEQGIGNRWSLGAAVVAYTFPGQTGNIDYDYEEISLVANYDDRAWLEIAWSPDLYATGRETTNIDLLTEWPLARDFIAIGRAGYYDTSSLTGIGYGYWQLGVARALGRFNVDLSFHDTNRSVPIVSPEDRGRQRVSLSVQVVF